MEHTSTPESLLAHIAAGDSDAFSKLYDDFSAALLGITIGILKNRAEAEEILQDIFVAIWEKASRFDPTQGSATAWLITLARHRALDALRSRQRREKLHQSAQDQSFLDEPNTTLPESPLIATERATQVHQILKTLPEEMRIVLELAFFHSLTQSEIALSLSEPLGTIKSRIRRAMERVRACILNDSHSQDSDLFPV